MNANPSAQPRPPQFTLRGLFVVMSVACLLLGLLVPALRSARESARRTSCRYNQLQIGLALHNYHDIYRSFPLAFLPDSQGQPAVTWRIAITPFMLSSPFYDRFQSNQPEPWNGPRNSLLADTFPKIYHCPGDISPEQMTSYLAVVGDGAAWPGATPTRFSDFTNGTANTILIVERGNSGIHWMEPRDLAFDEFSSSPSSERLLSTGHGDGGNVLFADASVRFLTDDISPDALRDMLLIAPEP